MPKTKTCAPRLIRMRACASGPTVKCTGETRCSRTFTKAPYIFLWASFY